MARESSTGSTLAVLPRRPVRFERRHGSAVVVKSYLVAEGAAIFAAMTDLWASPLGRARRGGPGMPEPLGFDARTGALTTAWVPGTPLGDRGRTAAAHSRSVEVGNLLAHLHGSGVVVDQVRDRPSLARSVRRGAADLAADPSTPGAVLEAFAEASLAVDRAWLHDQATPRQVLGHGALAPHSLLVNARGLVILDFDRLEMAEIERDLAHWAAWLWVTDGARGAAPNTVALLGDLVSGYAATSRRVPADRAALEVHLAVALIHVAHSWTSLRHDPLTRLRVVNAATALAQRHPAG